ncbi:DEAD/DEAH box helicase family protein (plasmid) [Streptomyces sp. NBC_00536]|uniref:DEAD/DEAH box helicase family protein n=1 Tax=Streptomyces sp. NBC_00536 TaxID=2975769 RepID=UPI002E80822B|nr:DEAD/DEAH box helicase family protein [Streptomyces sp. NBC_00536]WUC84449.1 DEAD/DEAH box helicase family protein [Streptomyces sp. NBC_00536]
MQITNAADRIAARLEAKRARRPWNADLHPRDSKGRFIETGGIARLWGGGMARVLRSLGGRQVLVENLSTHERSNIHASRLTMVARPDGTAPTRSKKKVRDEDERRQADGRRGTGQDAEDAGDQGDTPDDPHAQDDEGNGIGDDADGEDHGAGPEPDDDEPDEQQPAPKRARRDPKRRFKTLEDVRAHWASGKLRPSTDDEKAQASHNQRMAGLIDELEKPQLSRNGHFVVGRMTIRKNGREQSGWGVIHTDTGIRLTLTARKAEAADFANRIEDAQLDGEPIDWNNPDSFKRLATPEGRAMAGRLAKESSQAFAERAAKKREGATARTKPATSPSPEAQAARQVTERTGAPAGNVAVGHVGPKQAAGDERGRPRNSEELREFWKRGGDQNPAGEDTEKAQAEALRRMANDPKLRIHLASHHGFAIVEDTSRSDDWRFTVMTAGSGRRMSGLGPHRLGRYGNFPDQETADRFALYLGSNLRDGDGRTLDWGSPDVAKELAAFRDKDGQPSNVAIWLLAGQFDRERGMNDSQAARFGRPAPAAGTEEREGTRDSAGAPAPSDDVTPQQAAGQPRDNQEEQGERVQGAGEGVLDDVPAGGAGRAGGDDAAGDVLRADQRGDRGADRGVPGRLPGGDGSGDGLPGGDGQREHGDDAGAGEGAARDGVQPGEGAGDRGSGDAEGEPAEDRSRVGFGSREQEQTAPQFQPPEDGRSLVPSGVAARVKANIAAIEVLRRLETENRPATAAEQETLARWSGWGATPQVFVPNPKPEFEPLQKKLRALLTDDEWEAAEGNTLNAHYTDPSMVQAVWKAVRELGFDGGNVLEPGSGSGNFIGHAPEGAHMTGIELDPITAGIAKALYPQADVRNEGFEKTRAADGTFDLTIGNVPFGDYQVVDLRHNKGGHNIHNHFILKSLDLTRPGGLVAVVTSRYTMDGSTPRAEDARMEMARKADLVGAIRLPTGAHRRTAGTDVVTDLLIFRRREKDKEYTSGRLRNGEVKPPEQRKKDDPPVWVHSVKVEDLPGQPDDEAEKLLAPDVHVNPYFLDNPQNVLGEMEVGHGMYGPGELRVVGDGDLDASLDKALKKAVSRAKASGLSYTPETGERRKVELLPEGSNRIDGHVEVAPDGTFTQVRDGMIRPYDVPSTQAEEARQLLGLRDSFKALVAEEGRADADEQLIETLRGDLKARYDKYHAKFGSLNRFEWAKRKSTDPETGAAVEKAYRKRPPMGGLLTKDPTMAILLSLDSFDANTGTSTPAAIFTKRQAKHRSIAERASSPEDAMAIVMEQHPTLNGEALGKVMGLSPEAAREKLLAARSVDPDTGQEYPLVFEPHNGGDLIPAADYLSGNVRKRLEEAQALAGEDARFEINVKQLEAVLPPDISPGEIDAPLGASWLGAGPVQQFLRERLNTNLVTVSYQGGSLWKVDAPDSIKKGRVAQQVWGVPGFNAVKLAETILTNGRIRVTYQDESGKTYLDEEATAAAQTKADEMREEFQDWLWATPERSDAIKRAYNYTHNNLALRSYDGQRRTMPGLAEWFKPHPHQHAAVARMVNEPAVLLAHEVGAGKTAEMTMGVMELRRLGLINKAAMVVPNHMLQQFTDEFAELYPESAANGRILSASSEDLQGRKRREFIARVATGDYDAVILTQNAFESIPMRPEVQLEYIKREAKALKRALERQKEQDQADKPGVRTDSRMVKEIQNRLRKLEAKITAKIEASKDTAGLYFEDTGIDYVVVDEAHHYKNLSTNSGIPGAGIEGSNRASDLDMKLEYLRRNTKSGRVVTFATATPISNSVTEAHTMLRYLRPDLLEAARVRDFDEFASTYGKIVSGVELAADGSGFKEVSRFAAFRNMPELLRIWKTVADVKNSDDLAEYLDTPDVASGKAITISVEPTEQMLAYQDQLAARARAVKGGDIDPRVDNMLKISSDGRKVSLDPRMVGLDEKGLKLSTAADNIRRIYEDTKDAVYPTSKNNPTPHGTPGGLQIVFLDMGTPKDPGKAKKKGKKGDSPASMDELAESPFPAYQELKELLVERGVPADKVRFIHEAKNDAEKARLFHDARTGKIAVLVGSTAKMGTGTNVQLRATALHHLDCPWRPADLEQRNGRIIRQGNMNPEVAIFQYVTEQSFDGFSWQTVARKAKFIRQLMKGNLTDRTVEDIPDGVFNAEQVTAISTGNPHLLEQANVKASLAILKRKLKGHERTIEGYKSTIQATERLSKATDQLVAQLQDVVKRKKNTRGDDFNATIGNTDFTKRDEASKALATAALAVLRQGQNDPRDSRPPTVIGRVGGIEVTAKYRMSWDNHGRVHQVDISIPDVPQSRHTYTEEDLRTESNLRITRLEDSLADVEKKIVRAQSHLRQEERAAATARERVKRPFEQAAELEAAERRSKLVSAIIREQSRQVSSPEAGKEKAARLEQLEHQLREARIAAGEDSGDIDDPAAAQDTDLLPRTPAPPSISTDEKGRPRILWPDAEAKKAAKEREKREKVQRAREERGETVLDPEQVSSELAALREEEPSAPDAGQPEQDAGEPSVSAVDQPDQDAGQTAEEEPQAGSNALVDLHAELHTVDAAETRLHKTGIETWGTGDRVPDGIKLIRRAVLDAVAAMNDGEYDTTERRLLDARESIELLRDSFDDDEQAVEAPLRELADAIDAYLPKHRDKRDSLPAPASDATDGKDSESEVTLDPEQVRADLDGLTRETAPDNGKTSEPAQSEPDGVPAADGTEESSSTGQADDAAEQPADAGDAPADAAQPEETPTPTPEPDAEGESTDQPSSPSESDRGALNDALATDSKADGEDVELLDPEQVSAGDYVRVQTQNTAGNPVVRSGFLLAEPKQVTASRDRKRIKAWRLYIGAEGESPSPRNAVTILLDGKVERMPAPAPALLSGGEDEGEQHTNTLGWKGAEDERERVGEHNGKPLEVGELHMRGNQVERVVYLDGKPIGRLNDANGSWRAYDQEGGSVADRFFSGSGGQWDHGRYVQPDPTRDAAVAIATAHESGARPKIRFLHSADQIPQAEAERLMASHLDPRLRPRWDVSDTERGRARVYVDDNWAGDIKGKRDQWQVVGEDGKPSGTVYPTKDAAAQALAKDSPLLNIARGPSFHFPAHPREVSEDRLNRWIEESERWLAEDAPDLPDTAHTPHWVRKNLEALKKHREQRADAHARDRESLGGEERINALVARAELHETDRSQPNADSEEFRVRADGEDVGGIHRFGGFWQAYASNRRQSDFYDRDQAIAFLVSNHDERDAERHNSDTADDSVSRDQEVGQQEPQAEAENQEEDRDGQAPRRRQNGGDGGDGGEGPPNTPDAHPPGENAGDDRRDGQGSGENQPQDRRREQQRRRRDRDRRKPDAAGGDPGGGQPPAPRLPKDDRDRDRNNHGESSSSGDLDGPGRLKTLLARYRSGDVPAPQGADPERHAEYLRQLASNDSLNLSPDGNLITWTNTGATWRFGVAANGLHLEGWEAPGDQIGGREGARLLAGEYERLRDENGDGINWAQPQLDAEALRQWRDSRGEPLTDAIDFVRDSFIRARTQQDGPDHTGSGIEESAESPDSPGAAAGTDSDASAVPTVGSAAGEAAAAENEGLGNDVDTSQERSAESGGVGGDSPAATARPEGDGGQSPAPEQKRETNDGAPSGDPELDLRPFWGPNEGGYGNVVSNEGAIRRFGSLERMQELTARATLPGPALPTDHGHEVWLDGRLLGSINDLDIYNRTLYPESYEPKWQVVPQFFPTFQEPIYRSREAAIAEMVLRGLKDGPPDTSRVTKEMASDFDRWHDMFFPKSLPAGDFTDEEVERYEALDGLLRALGAGRTVSGDVADDVATAIDELRWLEDRYNKPQDENVHISPRALERSLAKTLDHLRPEDPRAAHHRENQYRAAMQALADLITDDVLDQSEEVPVGELLDGDVVVRLSGVRASTGSMVTSTGYLRGMPRKVTLKRGGVKTRAYRVRVGQTPWEDGGREETITVPVDAMVFRRANLSDVEIREEQLRYGVAVGERAPEHRYDPDTDGIDYEGRARTQAQQAESVVETSNTGEAAALPDAGDETPDAPDVPEPAAASGEGRTSSDTAEPAVERPARPADTSPSAGRPEAEEGPAGDDAAPEPDAEPEPVDGRPAEWVKVSELGISDLVRIEGITKTGTPRTLAGYVVDGPKEITTVQARRVQGMYRVLIAETPDGRGKRESVWVMPDATAARATRDDNDRVQGAPETGAEADIRAGRISERVPTDRSGQGLFPGSVVTDADGREGVVTGANANSARVQFGDDRSDDTHSPTSLNVTDGGAARPSGWTADGHLVRPGNVVGDRNGNMLGTVEDVDGDTATVATPQGMEDRPATDLRVLGGLKDVDSGQPAKVGRLERVPVTDINKGDSIIVDGPDGMTTVEVTGKEEVSPTHTRITAVDTTSGELHSLDGGADATYMRALDAEGRPVRLGPEDAPDSQGEITSRELAPAVDPVDGPTVEPQLSPEERNAIADRGEAPTDSPDAQQAAARIANDLPVTAEQASALAEELRDGADTATPEGRAAQRAADHLDAAAGNDVEEAGTPEPGTVGTVGVGDTIALPGEFDRDTMAAYRVVQIQDVPGGVRVLTIEDEDGMRFKRSLTASDPLYQLPEPEAPTDDPDAEPRDPNPGPDTDQLRADYADAVVRAVIDNAIEGTNTPGSIHQLREQIAQQLTPESLRASMRQARNGALAAITNTGVEGDQHDELVRSLRPEASRARTDAIRAALRTVDDLEPLDGESEEDTARRAADLLRLIPEALRSRPDSAPDDGQSPVDEAVTQHADEAVGEALQAAASGGPLTDERRAAIVAQLAERMAATRAATAERIAANVPAGRRPGVLARIVAGLVLLAQKLIALIAAFLKALAKLWRSGRAGLRRVRERISRFRRGLMQRVRSWPETRRLRRLAAAADLPEHADGLPLGDRVAHWARLLPAPGRFGQVSRRARWYRPTTRSSLAAGQLPPVQDGVRWTAERAVDGGPGPQTLRHLAALRAAGQDVDQDVVARLAAAAPELGDDPHGTVRHATDYAESAERRLRDLEAAAAGGAPDADLEIAATRVEAQSARQEAARLQQSYAAALPGAVRDSIAEVREVGPGTTASLVTTPDSDPGAVRALTDVSQFIPRDWLSPTEARFIGARSGDAGGYDPDSRIATVADLGDGGRRAAAHALLAHLQQHYPDLLAAQEAFHFTRTHSGRTGARRRTSLDALLARLFRGRTEQGGTGDLVALGLGTLFSGSWYEDDDLRAFLLGLLATR